MLRETSVNLLDLSDNQVGPLLDEVSVKKTLCFPIRDCVKFFVRMTASSSFTYAREKSDDLAIIINVFSSRASFHISCGGLPQVPTATWWPPR